MSPLIKKETAFLEKLKCLEHYQEVMAQSEVVYALIKELSKTEKEGTKPQQSPIPLLCENYYMLTRLSSFLSNLITIFADKARIKITAESLLVYEAYFSSLEDNMKKLKYEHNILVQFSENVM